MARYKLLHTPQDRRTRFGMTTTEDGWSLVFMEEGEADDVEIDYADILATAETVASAVITTEGTITAVVATATPKVTVSLSAPGDWGRVKVTTTLSTGTIRYDEIEIRSRIRYSPRVANDYSRQALSSKARNF